MPIFNDLKRIFFGAKSVAKHQASKAGDAAREMGDELKDQRDELIQNTKAAAGELMDKAPEYLEKGKDALEDLTDKIWREADAAVDKGKELKDQASEAINSKLEELTPTTAEPVDLDAKIGLDLEDLALPDTPEAPKAKAPLDFESDLIDDVETKASKAASSLKNAASGLKDAAGSALKKAADATAGVRGAAASAADSGLNAAAKAGAGLKDKAGDLAEKIGDVSEVVGGKVLEKGDDLLNRAAEVGADLKDKANDFIDHANTEAEKMKMEDAIEEAKRAAEVAEARARAFDGKEAERDTSESTLSGTGSFFDRAARFADGDYTNEGGKDMQIKQNPDAKPKEEGGLIAGFLDADGDGDSLIDDAQIIEEE